MLSSFFSFKQKTAYELRISDWSSDVCSSDLVPAPARPRPRTALRGLQRLHRPSWRATGALLPPPRARRKGCDAGAVGVESAERDDLSSLPARGMKFLVVDARRGTAPGPGTQASRDPHCPASADPSPTPP